jgi:predicted HAD superfamily hydrolase
MPQKRYSFDIFDTCLTRIYALPTDLFIALGRQLRDLGVWDGSSHEFKQLRVEAEQQARRAAAPKEVTLGAIYEKLGYLRKFSPEIIARMIEAEIALELASLRPVPEIAERIRGLHEAGEAVIYVSEMYLPPEVIRRALENAGIWKEGDHLYVSCESGLYKGRGLFELMLENEGLSAEDVVHTGDNFDGDIRYPDSIGISTVHFTATELTPYETRLRTPSSAESAEAASLYAGASRLGRLSLLKPQDETEAPFFETGASVIGPLFVPFVRWLMNEAVKQGIERLYFVARDGQIFQRLACQLPEAQTVECRYLYGSRQAWHLPGVLSLGEKDMDWVLDPDPALTLEGVLQRVNLSIEEFLACAKSSSLPATNQALTPADLGSLKEIFLSPAVCQLIETKAAEARKTTLGYLREQGLLDAGVSSAIVDIGWAGNMQRSLQTILSTASREIEIKGFYFHLRANRLENPAMGFSFMPSSAPPELVQKTYRWTCLLEIFARADHGGVLGYRWNGQAHEPILDCRGASAEMLRGAREQQAGAMAFHQAFNAMEGTPPPDLTSILNAIIYFFHTPSAAVAEAYGSLPFQTAQAGAVRIQLAPMLTFGKLLRGYIRGDVHTPWEYAMLMRSRGLSRMALAVYLGLRGLLRRH